MHASAAVMRFYIVSFALQISKEKSVSVGGGGEGRQQRRERGRGPCLCPICCFVDPPRSLRPEPQGWSRRGQRHSPKQRRSVCRGQAPPGIASYSAAHAAAPRGSFLLRVWLTAVQVSPVACATQRMCNSRAT